MKLLYMGGSSAGFSDLQRLLLVATELSFMDHPSVTFPEWGTIGFDSPMRRFSSDSAPVKLEVHAPPSGPARLTGYEQFVQADLESPTFRAVFLDGLARDELFARKVIQLDGDYGGLRGRDLRDQLVDDSTLREADLARFEAGVLKRVDPSEGRRSHLHMMISGASIEITSAQYVAAHSGAVPVTEVPTYGRLLALRTSDRRYVGGDFVAPWLATAILQAVVPDEVLQQLSIEQILNYREKSNDAYLSLMAEIDRLTNTIGDIDPSRAVKEIPRIVSADVLPKVHEYRNEMIGVRDQLFGDLIKRVVRLDLPSISLGFLSGMSFGVAAGAVIGGLAAVAPSLIDYVVGQRAIKRKNSFAYLLEVKPAVEIIVRP